MFSFILNNVQQQVSYRIPPTPFFSLCSFIQSFNRKEKYLWGEKYISYTQEIYQLTKTALEIKKRTCIDLFIKSSQAYTSLSYPDMQYFIIVSVAGRQIYRLKTRIDFFLLQFLNTLPSTDNLTVQTRFHASMNSIWIWLTENKTEIKTFPRCHHRT